VNAVGRGASASGASHVAVGVSATPSRPKPEEVGSVALGYSANASGAASLAVGLSRHRPRQS
jgi:hypothetical protein